MKQIKTITLAALCTLGAFSAIVYTSCKKDACKGVVCKNKGTCSNGTCTCPSGFSGKSCELSTIAFKNNTYTPVSITVNGAAYEIAKDSTLLVTDTAGRIAKVTASTSGKSADTAIGYVVKWAFSDTYPTDGTTFNQPLDVQAENPANNKEQVYYLEVVNNNALAVTQVVVLNIITQERTRIEMNLPKNGRTGIGYFIGAGNDALVANNFNPATFEFKQIAFEAVYMLPFTVNQKYTFTVN
ncbi:MAG: hypothetical protein JWQ38_237 [Flavipsychrobacter sp.]|nr:hypothetical protein [Flavipsychrobacter sp.]